MPVAIICLAGFAASVASAAGLLHRARTRGKSTPPSAVAWGVAFALVQAFFAVYAALGLAGQDVGAAVALNVALAVAAAASFGRPFLKPRLRASVAPGSHFPHPLVASVVGVLAASALATLGLEIPSNDVFANMDVQYLLLEWGLVAAPMLALFFLFQRRGAPPAVLAAALHVLGIAEYFVIAFKGMPIQPGDLTALGTAVAVSAGYVYELDASCLCGTALATVSLLLCQLAGLLRGPRGDDRRAARRRLLANVAVGLVLVAGLVAHVTLTDYYDTLNVHVYSWRPLGSYRREGFLPCFISSTQAIIPAKPDGYDADEAQALVDEYAADYDAGQGTSEERAAASEQFGEEQPSVIVIMNETFSDLSIYQNLHAGYEGPSYFNGLSDCLARGTLYVSAFGGGTSNTEFEFLTGSSMAYLASGVYPYTVYDLEEAESLARQFSELGYETCAMHPNHASNWNRENAYEELGFDDFLSIEDFEGAETLRDLVTDRATYDVILEMLREDDDPQFIFDVTMQNHSGYETGAIPADKRVDYAVDGVSDDELNEYLALIQESDEALEYLLTSLEELDRKVVVVFFGDHQPWLSSDYNDWFDDEDEAAHTERLWQTSYVIWANYDVAGCAQTSETDDLSANYLGSTLMELIGAPLTSYQKAQLALREDLPAINSTGFEDASGTWHLSSEAADESVDERTRRAREDLWRMQYYELFADGRDIFAKALQAEPNVTDPNEGS